MLNGSNPEVPEQSEQESKPEEKPSLMNIGKELESVASKLKQETDPVQEAIRKRLGKDLGHLFELTVSSGTHVKESPVEKRRIRIAKILTRLSNELGLVPANENPSETENNEPLSTETYIELREMERRVDNVTNLKQIIEQPPILLYLPNKGKNPDVVLSFIIRNKEFDLGNNIVKDNKVAYVDAEFTVGESADQALKDTIVALNKYLENNLNSSSTGRAYEFVYDFKKHEKDS